MKRYFLPLIIFVSSLFLSLYNISGFPKMVGDEGIYAAQAYWLSHFAKFGPYTYWYDHSPLGWIQIGFWQLLFGPTRFFDLSVLSGRVLIGILLAFSSTILYLLTKHLTKNKTVSFITALFFLTTPLTLTFSRMLLLDNMAVFWFLLSLVLLLPNPRKIKFLALSALSFSLSILTKESLLFFLPPYLLLVFQQNISNPHRKYSFLVSIITILFVLSLFPLLALLKGELLPHLNQVSFSETILFQLGRGSGLPFWQLGSHFREMLTVWLTIDPVYCFLGSLSTLYLLFSKPIINKVLASFSLFFILFLMRGGQIYDFYLIPLLPLLALNTGITLHNLSKLTKLKFLPFLFLFSLLIYLGNTSIYPFTSLATKSQLQAINYLKSIPSITSLVAPDYTYLDLYLDNPYLSINWYRKAESDVDVQDKLGTIANALIDEQFSRELDSGQLPFLSSVLSHLKLSEKFGSPLSPGETVKPYSSEYLELYRLPPETQTNYKEIVALNTTSPDYLDKLINNPPYALLLTRDNFTNSQDLESLLKTLKDNLPDTLLVTSQDGGLNNTIPWIINPGRDFYKSSGEAISATINKAKALNSLGFTGAIVTLASDKDGYLETIINAAKPYLLPIIRFNHSEVTVNTPIYVENSTDLSSLQSKKYPGTILLLTKF